MVPKGGHFVWSPFQGRGRLPMGKVKVRRFRSCRQDPLSGSSSQRTRDRQGAFRTSTIQSSPTPNGDGSTEKPPAVISKVCHACAHDNVCGRVSLQLHVYTHHGTDNSLLDGLHCLWVVSCQTHPSWTSISHLWCAVLSKNRLNMR